MSKFISATDPLIGSERKLKTHKDLIVIILGIKSHANNDHMQLDLRLMSYSTKHNCSLDESWWLKVSLSDDLLKPAVGCVESYHGSTNLKK